jgi:hypothetical protein
VSAPEPGRAAAADDSAARAAELRAELDALGLFHGDVEATGTLALLAGGAGSVPRGRQARQEVVRVALRHGFTNVALELREHPLADGAAAGDPTAVHAPVPRD